MSNVFGSLWAGLQPNFDASFGEPIRIEPQNTTRRARNVSLGADPVVQPFVVAGIFRGQTVVDRVVGSGSNNNENPEIVTQKITADFDAGQFGDANMPRQGWNVVLTSRPGAPRYGIIDVKPDLVARVWCSLDAMGNSA